MRVVILEDLQQVSARAADLVCQTIQRDPDCVLGLATGGSPVGTYQELLVRQQAGQISFAGVTTFNLDEYVGIPADHPQSYRSFMRQHLFDHADFVHDRCHLPDGNADDIRTAGEVYEQKIAAAGGIELQILGIGTDGHIAFNEPGSSLASRTRIKALTEQTRKDNARFFGSLEEVPKLAITMGVGTILDSRQIVLLATGANKASAVRAFIEGPVTAQVPASALQLHPQVTVLLDREAAGWLARSDYYNAVEKLQVEIESSGARRQVHAG
jgi:glucosamine-6-phosphate deaminase